MIRFETEQTIARSAEDVWAYAADITRHAEWMGVQDARLVSGQPTEVGARALERMKLGPMKLDVEFEVSDSVPARRIAWRTNGDGPLAADVTLELEALGPDRTRAVWSGSIGLTRWWRVIEPLMAAEVKAGEAGELRRLKERLEMTPPSCLRRREHRPTSAVSSRWECPRRDRFPLDIRATPRFAAAMRIGEIASRVGVSTDTVRFYERSGWLPRASRRDNDYREYGEPDVEHLRLLIDLRRLDVPLADAGKIASWCHSGHCADATAELPRLIVERRADIADRIAGLQALDTRLADLEGHLVRPRRSLQVLDASGPCCDAADAVVGSVEGGCACCAPTS